MHCARGAPVRVRQHEAVKLYRTAVPQIDSVTGVKSKSRWPTQERRPGLRHGAVVHPLESTIAVSRMSGQMGIMEFEL